MVKMPKGTRIGQVSIALAVFVAALAVWFVIDSRTQAEDRPSIILIIIDTLRADHVGCYGYERNTTPNLDKFAADAVLFKHVISPAPWTTPAVASIFTAQYPHVLGYDDEVVVLDDGFPCLAEVLRNNGYTTAGIISHLYISEALGFAQGFDSYDDENAKGHGHVSSPSVTAKAIAFLEEHQDERFFLFVHYFDPHCDYILHEPHNYYPDYEGPLRSGQPIQELRERAAGMTAEDVRYLNALYDSEIRFTDGYVGDLLRSLKDLNLYDNALIVITADHGEEFLERGNHWIGHTKTVYQELVRVPLIVRVPRQAAGRTVDRCVGLADLGPTILGCVGLEMPDGYASDGEVLDVEGGKEPKARALFSETRRWGAFQAVVQDEWKLIHDLDSGTTSLFNVAEDPGEHHDLAGDNTARLRKMEAALHKWDYEMRIRRGRLETHKPKLNRQQVDQLKSLGYIH